MSRVRVANYGWGVVTDTRGNVQAAKAVTLTEVDGSPVTLYASETGTSTIAKVTNSRGEIPGWVEPGSYVLSVGDLSEVRVEAAPGWALNESRRPLGFADGGFVRTQTTPVVNRTSESEAFRDPAVYVEDRGPMRHFWLYGAVTEDLGPAVTTGFIGLYTAVVPQGVEPTDDDFTYEGMVIDPADVPTSATGGDQAGFVGPSGVLYLGGEYHTWPVAIANDWGDVTTGSIVHFTAPTPAGPWSYEGVATQPEAGEATTHDNCCPVFFKGQWIMAVKVFDDALTNFTLRFYTAPGDADTAPTTWTREAIPTVIGGYNTLQAPDPRAGEMQGDSPILFVDGGRLYYGLVTLAWFTALYDVSDDLATMNYRGSVFQIPDSTGATTSEESGSSQFGAGNWFRIGDEIYYAYHALPRPNASTSYQRAFLAKWQPGRDVYVPLPTTVLVLNDAITAGAVETVDVPTTVPYEAVALDMGLNAREQSGTLGNNKHLTLRSSSATNGLDPYLQVFGPVQGAKLAGRGRVPLLPGGNPRTLKVASENSFAGVYDVTINGYWRLP